jgi:hypothetical protein
MINHNTVAGGEVRQSPGGDVEAALRRARMPDIATIDSELHWWRLFAVRLGSGVAAAVD